MIFLSIKVKFGSSGVILLFSFSFFFLETETKHLHSLNDEYKKDKQFFEDVQKFVRK